MAIIADKGPLETSKRGTSGVPVFIQDQTTGVLDLPFLREANTYTLASPTVVNTRTITLTTSPTPADIIGRTLEIASATNGSHFMQSTVLNSVGPVVTLDTPINRVFTVDSFVVTSDANMAVNGSVTPQVFSVKPLPSQKGDMVRIIFTMSDNDDMDFTTFGGISGGLTNGIVLRVNNGDGTYRNIANFKTNGDIANYTFDTDYYTNNGLNVRGMAARATWGGQDKHGVVVRLDGSKGEAMEFVVQDDLTSLLTLKPYLQGSEVQE